MQIPQIGKIAKNAEFSFIGGNLAFFAILPILGYLHFWDFCVASLGSKTLLSVGTSKVQEFVG